MVEDCGSRIVSFEFEFLLIYYWMNRFVGDLCIMRISLSLTAWDTSRYAKNKIKNKKTTRKKLANK